MIRDEQGSMSAFLAMLFLVFLLLISVCVEGIYMYTARGKAMGIYMSGLSHTKGNYQKELADMYHIYAMDPRYHKKIETDFSDRMKESLDQNGDPFRFQTGSTKISDILDLSAQKGEVLKYQIRQQMQYEAAGDILKNLTKKIKAGEDQKNELSGIKDQIQKEEEEAEETENEKTLTSEPVKKDPRKGFMKLLKEGSVPLIMGEKKVSDLPINIVSFFPFADSLSYYMNFDRKFFLCVSFCFSYYFQILIKHNYCLSLYFDVLNLHQNISLRQATRVNIILLSSLTILVYHFLMFQRQYLNQHFHNHVQYDFSIHT